MLSDDRFLFSDVEGQSALRLHPAVGAGRCCAFYLKGVMEEITGVSPATAVNSGQVSIQEDRELSQRLTFSHPYPSLTAFVFLPLHPLSKHRWWPHRASVPKADLLFVVLVWLGFPLVGWQRNGEKRSFHPPEPMD